MAGIAGIAKGGCSDKVKGMLESIKHRGSDRITLSENHGTTTGISYNNSEEKHVLEYLDSGRFCDSKGSFHCAWAKPLAGDFILKRDEIGVVPLYYGWDSEDTLYFASEVKALLPHLTEIEIMPPGNIMENRQIYRYYELSNKGTVKNDNPDVIARLLKEKLEGAVKDFIDNDDVGSWLSGGLDSSTICAIATKYVNRLQTFAAGVEGAPDLEYAREVAKYIKSDHHEVRVTAKEMIRTLPEVIFHLESFDALLVRSSVTNFIVAEKASEYVPEVFSGEGGDELFAGYEYLKHLPSGQLTAELIKITNSLHNTALQRVDRCSSAHGTIAHVPFLHPGVVEYAVSIPAGLKLHNGIEKWILRKAMEDDLPEGVMNRPKAKFWEGAGVKEIISTYAEKNITDKDFRNERRLYNGWTLNTREELYYYRIFRDHFGDNINLGWMGRTENSPKTL